MHRAERHLILAFVILVVAASAGFAQQTERATVTILQLNDVYQISPVDGGKSGGMARVATLQKSIRLQSPHALFLLAGDFLSPSVASRLFKGEQMVAALGAAGLDIATLGNHEFDFGPDVLRERMKQSRFEYTVANVLDRSTGRPFGGAWPYIIRDLGGVRVGVFGLLLAETRTMSSPGPGVRFDDPIETGVRVSRELRARGADLVIALTHLPMNEDKRLAALADIDLIVGGHEHEVLQSLSGRTPILKMGSDARNLGRIDLHVVKEGSRFRLESMDWEIIPVNESVKEDPEVAALVAGYEAKISASLDEVIGRTSVMLDARVSSVRRTESNLGNFIADAYRSALAADVALVNGGSIRSNSTFGPGEITRRTILTILPFENAIVKVRVTGQHLKRLLEHGVSEVGEESGRFPQVSGIEFVYDASRPPGSRVTSVRVGGKPLAEGGKYSVAVSAYVQGGGDGYDFKGAEVLVSAEEGPLEPDIVMEAVKKAGTIAPTTEGRISVVAATRSAQAPSLRKARSVLRLPRLRGVLTGREQWVTPAESRVLAAGQDSLRGFATIYTQVLSLADRNSQPHRSALMLGRGGLY